MSDEKDFHDDLYGDLDLEDIDATQLEDELTEPPPEPEPVAPAPAPAQQTQQYSQPSAPGPAGQNGNNGMGGYGQNQNQNQIQGGGPVSNGFSFQPQPGGFDGGNRPSDAPDEGKMFIGGLNWETTDEGLRAYMGTFGEIASSTIMRDPSGRSRGFAFLTFANPASVDKVMTQVHHLDGKQIDPKRAIPRDAHEKTAKVFVGGLAATVTSESLKIFLSQFGEVHDATVMYDRETGRSKGFAFATFADEQSVGVAMDASGIELDGKQIEIKKAQPRGSGNLVKNFNAPGGGNGGRFNNQGGNMGGGMMGMGGGGGFDPNAMAMMYANMMKGQGGMGGGMGMGFDPSAMAMMYQNMMKNMAGMNAPAINPNMARNGGMGMMGGMGGMGGMGMGGMGMGGMGMMGNNMGMMGGNGGGGGGSGMGRPNPPNAPRGPAAMRNTGDSTQQGGAGAQRYSTQGNARAKPY